MGVVYILYTPGVSGGGGYPPIMHYYRGGGSRSAGGGGFPRCRRRSPNALHARMLNVPNASSSSRDHALAALCFLRAYFLSARFPVIFSEQMPSAFHSVPGVFYPGSRLRSSDVLGAALPPRLDFSIVDTSAYLLRVPSEHSSSPRFGSRVVSIWVGSYWTNPFFSTCFPLSTQVSPISHMASASLVRFLALLRLSSALPDPILVPVPVPILIPISFFLLSVYCIFHP